MEKGNQKSSRSLAVAMPGPSPRRALLTRLPTKFQSKLNLPHRHLRLSEHAEIRTQGSVPVKRLEFVSCRGCEVRAIRYVEELGPELDVEIFPEFFDVVVFGKGQISVDQPWPNDRVAPQVAHKVETAESRNVTRRSRDKRG